MLRWTDSSIGEGIVDIVLSLNEQTQKLHNTEVATASYSGVTPSLTSLDEIVDSIEVISGQIQPLQGHQGRYLRSMVNSFRYFARNLQGDKIPYDFVSFITSEITFLVSNS